MRNNTASQTLTSHDLTDSHLGAILIDFPYSLAPGASAFLTQEATITQSTTNTATWTASNDVVTLSDDDIATVTVN